MVYPDICHAKYNQYSTIDVTETLPSTFFQQERGHSRDCTLHDFTGHMLQKFFRGSITFVDLKSSNFIKSCLSFLL